MADSPALLAWLLGETVRIPACVGRHPKVAAGWNIAARAIGHPKVLPAGQQRCGLRAARSRQHPALPHVKEPRHDPPVPGDQRTSLVTLAVHAT